jgi:DNA-binding ferritin-like protein
MRGSIGESYKLEESDTPDTFTKISRRADKRLWFLEAHLGYH